jgi:hypothetical protein
MLYTRTDYAFRFLNVIGWVLLYAAFFLYEDQEARIHNRIEEWWIRINDTHHAARSRAAAFMQGVASLTERGFNRLFGKRLLSLRLIGISVCFSIASFFLFGFVSSAINHKPPEGSPLGAFCWFLFFVSIGLVPAFSENQWVLRWWGVAVVAQLVPLGKLLLFASSVRGGAFAARGVGYLLLAFGIGFASDVSYIVLTRWILRRVSRIDRAPEIILAIVGNLLILVILLLAPIEIGMKVFPLAPTIAAVIMFSFVLNAVSFVVGSASLFLAFLLLLHRLVWPVIERPLYAIHRFGLIRNKNLLWKIGLALVTLPTDSGVSGLKHLVQKFG